MYGTGEFYNHWSSVWSRKRGIDIYCKRDGRLEIRAHFRGGTQKGNSRRKPSPTENMARATKKKR